MRYITLKSHVLKVIQIPNFCLSASMSNKNLNHYETLCLNNEATSAEIKTAFYKLSKEYHPDVNQEDSAMRKFQEINDAYEVLGNYESKKNYDRTMFPGHFRRAQKSDSSNTHSSSMQSSDASYTTNENYTEFYKERLTKQSAKPGGLSSTSSNDFDYQSYYQSHYSSSNPNPRVNRNSQSHEERMIRRNERLQSLYMRNLLLTCILFVMMFFGFQSMNAGIPKVVLNTVERSKKENKGVDR